MQVEILKGLDPACDEFVKEHETGRLAQLPAWSEMITNLFGYTPYYLVARGEGKAVKGILPLMHVKTFLFGNQMISQAFNDYGGILADSDAASDALFEKAVELAQQHGCDTLELRNIEPLPYDLKLRDDKVTMFISLEGGAQAVWEKARPEIRKQTRKAERSGLAAVNGREDLLDDFYDIYSRRMHQLGTPAYPRQLMAAMIETFPDLVKIFAVRLEDKTVAAGLMTCFNGIAEIPWSATLGQYNRMYPNRLLYWTMIQYYAEHGARIYDFGRSTAGSGNYEFKRRWRAEPVRLHYQYWVRPGMELSIVSPDNPKYQKKVAMWRKLPYWLARRLGPVVSRRLA